MLGVLTSGVAAEVGDKIVSDARGVTSTVGTCMPATELDLDSDFVSVWLRTGCSTSILEARWRRRPSVSAIARPEAMPAAKPTAESGENPGIVPNRRAANDSSKDGRFHEGVTEASPADAFEKGIYHLKNRAVPSSQ